MKASELIELLAELKAKHGDLEVEYMCSINDDGELEGARINDAWGTPVIELH